MTYLSVFIDPDATDVGVEHLDGKHPPYAVLWHGVSWRQVWAFDERIAIYFPKDWRYHD